MRLVPNTHCVGEACVSLVTVVMIDTKHRLVLHFHSFLIRHSKRSLPRGLSYSATHAISIPGQGEEQSLAGWKQGSLEIDLTS